MIVFFIACLWSLWFFFIVSKLVKNIIVRVDKWNDNVDEVRYLIANIKSKVSGFILKIIDRKNQKQAK